MEDRGWLKDGGPYGRLRGRSGASANGDLFSGT
jgi:hypothetical protein